MAGIPGGGRADAPALAAHSHRDLRPCAKLHAHLGIDLDRSRSVPRFGGPRFDAAVGTIFVTVGQAQVQHGRRL